LRNTTQAFWSAILEGEQRQQHYDKDNLGEVTKKGRIKRGGVEDVKLAYGSDTNCRWRGVSND